jgi:hypothetical protein
MTPGKSRLATMIVGIDSVHLPLNIASPRDSAIIRQQKKVITLLRISELELVVVGWFGDIRLEFEVG